MVDINQDAPRDGSIDKVERRARTLKEALREVRDTNADRTDMIVETRAAETAQLEALAEEIAPLVAELDPADDRFEFVLGNGERARYWIDMTTFVAMDHDRETFRLLKDTRMGRLVLAETSNLQIMGDEISHYVAERVIERERMIEGDWHNSKQRALVEAQNTTPQRSNATKGATAQNRPNEGQVKETVASARKRGGFIRHLMSFLSGIALTVAAAALAAWAFLPTVFAQISDWFRQLIS